MKITIAIGTGTIDRIIRPAAKRRRRRCLRKVHALTRIQDHHLSERDPDGRRHP